MMTYIGNAFSLQMVQGTTDIRIEDVTAKEVAAVVNSDYALGRIVFCIGHRDTAAVALNELRDELAKLPTDWMELSVDDVFKRVNVSLHPGDVLYVLQVMGGRLPEGCTELPEGISLAWRKVTVR